MNGIKFEAVDEAIKQVDEEMGAKDEKETPYNENPKTGKKFDLEKIVLELETIGNRWIDSNIHSKLKFSDEEIAFHSEMLSYVLEKNFSLEQLKSTPEYVLTAQTLLMGAKFYRTMEELKKAGEL